MSNWNACVLSVLGGISLPLYLCSTECGQNNFLPRYVHIYHSYYPSIRIINVPNYKVSDSSELRDA